MKIFSKVFFLVFFFIFPNNSFSEKISIIYTVNNIPITNIEIKNEIAYLKLINKKLNQMDDKSLVVYASKSLLREKIKENEVLRYFEFGLNDKVVNENFRNLMLSIGINNLDEFSILLSTLNLNEKFIKKKIEIEVLWNELIYQKYQNKLSIDKEKIKEKLKNKIDNQNNETEEYLLSEILFKPISKDLEKDEIEKIKKSINDIGFENTAMIYSLSSTASSGGNIGWLKKNQLSEKILFEIQNIKIGEISNIINTPTGKLLLTLKDKRKVKEKISFEDELNKALTIERNKQLNQFSAIYFKKVELDTIINEK